MFSVWLFYHASSMLKAGPGVYCLEVVPNNWGQTTFSRVICRCLVAARKDKAVIFQSDQRRTEKPGDRRTVANSTVLPVGVVRTPEIWRHSSQATGLRNDHSRAGVAVE